MRKNDQERRMRAELAYVAPGRNSVAAVATWCYTWDVKGVRNDIRRNPLARWLRAEWPHARIRVYGGGFFLNSGGNPSCSHAYLPDQLARFLRAFNAGRYPHLEARR